MISDGSCDEGFGFPMVGEGDDVSHGSSDNVVGTSKPSLMPLWSSPMPLPPAEAALMIPASATAGLPSPPPAETATLMVPASRLGIPQAGAVVLSSPRTCSVDESASRRMGVIDAAEVEKAKPVGVYG